MNTAILWDIENVTPPRGTNYIQTIIDKITETDRISYAMAFGDWNRSNIKNIAADLATNSFELIHIPASRKDSSDMSMVAHGVELIFQYPHVEKFVLITGDADFRPLLQSLKKYGKQTLIICDVTNNASEDLLRMADEFLDYRDIIESDDAGDDTVQDIDDKMTKKQAFELLADALDSMLKEQKIPQLGALKIKMKLLNSSFNESYLGYRTWKAFINDAIKQTNIAYSEDNDNVLVFKSDGSRKQQLPEVFVKLLDALPKAGWVAFNEVAKHVNCHDYGYIRFKKLALDAEKRGLVQIENSGRTWRIQRV